MTQRISEQTIYYISLTSNLQFCYIPEIFNKMPTHLSGFKLFFKTTVWTVIFLSIFFLLTLGGIAWWGYAYLNKVTTVGGIDLSTLKDNIVSGWNSELLNNKADITFLVLGVDSVPNKPDAPQLTDTILLLNLNLNDGTLNAVSLPRDLWSEAYKTKINALYSYGKERNPEDPTTFPKQAIEEMTSIPIDTVVVLTLDTVDEVIDAVGGIEIDVEHAFTDTEFPRSDVDPASKDPILLYETVSFFQGKQMMDGSTAIKYIRSRKSADKEEGTDLARSKRQTQVIDALMHKVTNKKSIRNPEVVGEILKIYNQKFSQTLPLPDMVAIGKKLYIEGASQVVFKTHSLTVYPDVELGVITHPELSRDHQNQWVYVVKDKKAFTEQLHRYLGKPIQESASNSD